ncbi:MAG: hypothetical protein QM727_12190 [Niabella sp.]
MELKIFQRILFDSLMPWLINSANERVMLANLKKTNDNDVADVKELTHKLQSLLANHPDMVAWLQSQLSAKEIGIESLLFTSELPQYSDGITKYYTDLINLEALRIFNIYSTEAKQWTDVDIINYRTEMLLRDIKRFLIRATEKIQELDFTSVEQKDLPLIPFVLYYLKYQLINLYFSIQELHKDKLIENIDVNYLYLTILNEKKSQIRYIYPTVKTKPDTKTGKSQITKLTFGCNLKKEKLRPIINQLCDEIDLLNEDISPADELLDLLFSRDIKPGVKKIQTNCDNKNFRYVIEKLIPHFDNLTFINIEHSQSFYTKKGKIFTSNDFSKAKSHDPKLKATIDSIFQQLQ